MNKDEILSKLSNIPESELLAFLKQHEQQKPIYEKPIPHPELNEHFVLTYWDGDTHSYTTFDYFMKKLENIFNKTPYGVETYQFYGFPGDYHEVVEYKHPEEALELIKKSIIKCTADANFALLRQIELFNKKQEVIWNVSYENDVTKNLDFTEEMLKEASSLSGNFPVKLLDSYKNQDFVKKIKKGLQYISDHLYMKEEGVSKWDDIEKDPYARAERDHFFKDLQSDFLTFNIAMKNAKEEPSAAEKVIQTAERILFARYKY